MGTIFVLPIIYAATMFFLWLRNRSSSSAKGKLPGGVALVVLSRLIMGGYVAISVIFGADFSAVLRYLITYAVEFLIFAYYYGVVKRFAGK